MIEKKDWFQENILRIYKNEFRNKNDSQFKFEIRKLRDNERNANKLQPLEQLLSFLMLLNLMSLMIALL